MTIELVVGGQPFADFLGATVSLKLQELANQFRFVATSRDGVPLPFLGGEECRVRVDGEQVLRGFVELVEPRGDEGDHSISVSGRDRTVDLLESQIGTLDDIRPPITLKALCELVIGHIGANLAVVDALNPSPYNAKEDLLAPEPGDNAFQWLEQNARKRQALLTSTSDGNVLITRSSGQRSGGQIVHKADGGERNNVLEYSGSYSTSGLFNRYVMSSQRSALAGIGGGGTLDDSAVVDQGASITDPRIRRGRQLVISGESMSSSGEASERVRWERDVRRARARVFSVTVDGFRDQAGELWAVNRLVRVDSDFAGIDSIMLVDSVTFEIGEDTGSTTTLSLVPRDAYTLAQAEPQAEEQETGIGLSLPT